MRTLHTVAGGVSAAALNGATMSATTETHSGSGEQQPQSPHRSPPGPGAVLTRCSDRLGLRRAADRVFALPCTRFPNKGDDDVVPLAGRPGNDHRRNLLQRY